LYCHPRGLPSFPTRRSSDLLVISLFISVLLSLADSHTIAKSLQAVKHLVAVFLVDHVAMIDPGQVLGVLERCLPRLLLELARLALCAGWVPRLRPTGSALPTVGGSAPGHLPNTHLPSHSSCFSTRSATATANGTPSTASA